MRISSATVYCVVIIFNPYLPCGSQAFPSGKGYQSASSLLGRAAADDDGFTLDGSYSEDLSSIKSFAAIGDSYAAGLGAGIKDDWGCSRYYDSYPRLISRDENFGPQPPSSQFLACSGHTTNDMYYLQVPGLDGNIDALTISAGGNDVELSTILNDCVFGWLAQTEETCQKTMQTAASKIQNELPGNLDRLLAYAKTKLRSGTGRIYFVGYTKFFAVDNTQCDSVSWAWYQNRIPDEAKHYLTQQKRSDLNDLVDRTNDQIKAAVARSGSQVVYVDVDTYYEIWGGRYCEAGVTEPDPNNEFLLYFERYTKDANFPVDIESRQVGADKADIVANGTFEAQIAEWISQNLVEHPDWAEDLDGGEGGSDVDEVEWLGNITVRAAVPSWFIPDSSKRVFHPRSNGHAIIAMLVVYHMGVEQAKMAGQQSGPEIESWATCPVNLGHPSLHPGCAKNSVPYVPKTLKTPEGDTWDTNGIIIELRQNSCTNQCSIPPKIPAGMVAIYQNADKTDCEISVALPNNVEAWVYRATPSTGSEWQDCWDSFINITAQCIAGGPNNGWVNGPDAYEYFQAGFRPINAPTALHAPLDPKFHLIDPNPPTPDTSSWTCHNTCPNDLTDDFTTNWCVQNCKCTVENGGLVISCPL